MTKCLSINGRRQTFVGDDRFRFMPQTVQRVGDKLPLLLDRRDALATGDVAISRRPVDRTPTVGELERER